MNDEKIRDIEAQIADLKKRWPKHSVPAALIEQLDDLEEQLTEALKGAQEEKHAKAEEHD